MELTIHRGSHEIGGTCIRISSGTTSILLDAGLPLSANSTELSRADLDADAVVISHPHQDHCGLIETLPTKMPVYIGRVGKSLLEATRTFLRRETLKNDFHYIQSWQPFNIGEITLTPYLVDHSASDAYAFLIEAEGKKIFYSGDFRAHGRKSILFDSFVNQPPRGIDMLLMEGTMLQRDNSDFPTEESVETTIATVLSAQDNISFLISSSQNIDRIVSAFRACKRTDKILVIDLYTAWVLEQMRQVTNNVPTIDWEHVKVAFDKTRASVLMSRDNRAMFGSFVDRAIRNRVTGSELTSNPHKCLMLLKISSGRLIKKFALQEKPVTVIYSQWQGYLNQVEGAVGNNKAAADMREMKAGMIPGVTFLYAHTSGHATVADLQYFAAALNPNKLVPIHTEYGSLYKDHFENVLEIADGETVEVQ